MGVGCSCQKVESEEETVMRIFSNMNLAEIETKSVYGEFIKCINKEDGYLDYFLFKNFLDKIVGDNNYKDAQVGFFENLRKLDSRKENIKKIGSLIVFISKGTQYQKIESLYSHYLKYYKTLDEHTVKEFINDLIDANTDNCLQAFRENFGYETITTLNEVYKKIRKRQLLYHIYNNFERVKIKYFHQSPLKTLTEKLNSSFDLENLNDDIGEVYERYSKNQCDLLKHQFTLDAKKLNDEEKIIREFIELAFNHLKGEYMRNWLYEDYLKEKSFENVCI